MGFEKVNVRRSVDHVGLHQRHTVLLSESRGFGSNRPVPAGQPSRYVLRLATLQRKLETDLFVGIEVEKALGVAPPETLSVDPERPLYEACRRMLDSRARRIPLVTNDSQTDRSHVLSVVTQYRILKFVAVNVSDTQKLRRPLQELLIGTYDNIATASMDTPVIDVIHILVERSISSIPILNSEGMNRISTSKTND